MSISVVSPSDTEPTHDVTLTDGTTVVGFIACDSLGRKTNMGITMQPLDRSAIKISEGQSKYDDLQMPHMDIAQSDWSAGRASRDFDSDTTRYYDSQQCDTWHGGLMLGGQPTYCTGYRTQDMVQPGSMTWTSLSTAGTQYIARKIVSGSTAWNADKAEIWVRRRGTPTGTLTFALCGSGATAPGATLKTATVTSTTITDTIGVLHEFDWTTTQSVSSSMGEYWIKIYDAGTPSTSNYWQVGTDSSTTGNTYISASGSTWVAGSNGLYYRVTDADAPSTFRFFNYKGQVYAVREYDDGTSYGKIYRNGYRGVVDTGTSSTLVDAAQSWTTDALIGSIAEIYDGVGVDERQRWRTITDNDATSVSVSPDWNVTQLATSEDATQYNILKSNVWAQTSTTTWVPNTGDVEVAGELIYIGGGENKTESYSKPLVKYNEYSAIANDGTLATTWTIQSTTEYGCQASQLLTTYDNVNDQWLLWQARNNDADGDSIVVKYVVPNDYNSAFNPPRAYVSGSSKGFMREKTVSDVTPTSYPNNIAILAINSSFSTGLICTDKITSQDWREYDHLFMMIRSTIDLAAGDLQLVIDNTALCASPLATIDFPAITANQSYYTFHSIREYDLSLMDSFGIGDTENADAIVSVGLNMAEDKNANYTLYLKFGYLYTDNIGKVIKVGDSSDKITNLIAYEDPRIPYVIKEGSIWKIENDTPYQLPLDEMMAIKSHLNGRAACVSDVYLTFSLGGKGNIQQYFNQQMRSIGLDQDEGLPSGRQGPVVDMVSYPGGDIYAAVDGGSSGTSAVYLYDGGGWHEVYRAPRTGDRIRKLHIQALPDGTRRLFISQGGDIVWIPISDSPYHDTDYRFIHEAVLETGWYYAGFIDIYKHFKSMTMFGEGFNSSAQTVEMDYKVDSDTSWTPVSGAFDTTPSETLNLSSSAPPTINAKRIKFRYRLQTNDNTKTPKVDATVLKCYAVVPTKYNYGWLAKLTELDRSIDYQGDEESTLGEYATVEAALTALTSWVNNATALTQNSKFSIADDKTVILNPIAIRSLRAMPDEQIEEHLIAITTTEV